MTLQIEDAVADRYRSRASEKGLSLERYLAKVLEEHAPELPLKRGAPGAVSPDAARRVEAFRRATEHARQMLEGRDLPPVPDGAFDAEWLYEGND